MIKPALLILSTCAAVLLVAGCGSSDGTTAQTDTTPPGTPVATPRPTSSSVSLRAEVHARAAHMMSDIEAAETRGDIIDGVPVGTSDNPYDYVGISPAFTKLVALGKPALPAIAAEILASKQDGLREYLLAAAGAQIHGDTPGSGQSWSSGKEWARWYADAQ